MTAVHGLRVTGDDCEIGARRLIRHDAALLPVAQRTERNVIARREIFLADAEHIVSVVNPARIKGFAQSQMNRTKTDKRIRRVVRDAETLAERTGGVTRAPADRDDPVD